MEPIQGLQVRSPASLGSYGCDLKLRSRLVRPMYWADIKTKFTQSVTYRYTVNANRAGSNAQAGQSSSFAHYKCLKFPGLFTFSAQFLINIYNHTACATKFN